MARFCDDIVVLAHGKVVMRGRTRDVFSRAEELSQVGLNIPEISRVCIMLRDHGVPVDYGIFTVEQAKQSLLPLLGVHDQHQKQGGGQS